MLGTLVASYLLLGAGSWVLVAGDKLLAIAI
jgi:hypothetical protein